MSSEHTKEPTQAFFAENNYFGLDKENVTLFEQNLLPCMGFDGKIFLASQHKVSLAPGILFYFCNKEFSCVYGHMTSYPFVKLYAFDAKLVYNYTQCP